MPSTDGAAETPTRKRAMMAKVHIAKKDLGIDEETYRAVLERATGLRSATACSTVQLDAALEEFKRLGWAPKTRRPTLSQKPHVRLVWALWGQLKPHLRDGSARALRSFTKRMTGIADPEWLDAQQASVVSEGIKAWLKRVQAAAEAEKIDA
jgi:phage gp16-like protein